MDRQSSLLSAYPVNAVVFKYSGGILNTDASGTASPSFSPFLMPVLEVRFIFCYVVSGSPQSATRHFTQAPLAQLP